MKSISTVAKLLALIVLFTLEWGSYYATVYFLHESIRFEEPLSLWVLVSLPMAILFIVKTAYGKGLKGGTDRVTRVMASNLKMTDLTELLKKMEDK